MKWFHKIVGDELLSDRRGFILVTNPWAERFTERIEQVNLLIIITGRKRREFLTDFRNRVVIARPEYWIRFFWERKPGKRFGCFGVCRGTYPVTRGKEMKLLRKVDLYEAAGE